MIVSVNGKGTELPEGTTAEDLVRIMGLQSDRVAVEIDGEICPRQVRPVTVLRGGQVVELVGFVGGG